MPICYHLLKLTERQSFKPRLGSFSTRLLLALAEVPSVIFGPATELHLRHTHTQVFCSCSGYLALADKLPRDIMSRINSRFGSLDSKRSIPAHQGRKQLFF